MTEPTQHDPAEHRRYLARSECPICAQTIAGFIRDELPALLAEALRQPVVFELLGGPDDDAAALVAKIAQRRAEGTTDA